MAEVALDDQQDTTPPSPSGAPPILPNIGPDTLRRIARQSRPLTAKEADTIKRTFGNSVDPNDMRIAYDAGISGTNLHGYVMHKSLPTVMFFPTDIGEMSPDLLHEATHVWQNLGRNRYTIPIGGDYDTSTADREHFTANTSDQQAELVRAGDPSALRFIQGHTVRAASPGDMAFIDSIRAGDKNQYPSIDPNGDVAARLNASSPKGFTSLRYAGNGRYSLINAEDLLKSEKTEGTALGKDQAFDVDGARKAGYSDDEIAQHLAQTRGFDYRGAIKAGYTPADVLQHLSGQAATATPPNPDEAKGVYQNIGEGIKEAWDVPKMLDQAGDAVGKLVDVATGDAKSQNNLRHPIEFAKRLISGVTGPSNLSTSEKVARGVGNAAGGAMLGSVAPEATAAVDAAPGAAADALGQNFSKSAVTRNMGKEIGGSLDRVAGEAGLPASKQVALSGKAAEVVTGLKQQAQKIYTALDKASGGRYQRFVDKIDELEDALRSKYTTPDVAAKLKDQLVEVRGDYAQTQADLVKQGVDPATIKAADAKWAQAKALEQVGKKFKVGESLSGDLKPGTLSIDTGLKNLKPHILRQATEGPPIKESPIVSFRKEAQQIEAQVPAVRDGYTRLWRGNRPDEVGKNPQFTNDLSGIALPFRKQYGGKISYVDVPTADLPKYMHRVGVAPGAEFGLPKELAAQARVAPRPATPPSTASEITSAVTKATDRLSKVRRNQRLATVLGGAAGGGYAVHHIVKTLSGDH